MTSIFHYMTNTSLKQLFAILQQPMVEIGQHHIVLIPITNKIGGLRLLRH